MYSDNWIPEILNTTHSCSRDSPATVWLTSERPETLYLFQKYILCWDHEYIVSRNKITAVKVTFCVFSYNLLLLKVFDTPLHSIAYKKLHSPASFMIMFLKRNENSWSCASSASLLIGLPLHSRAVRDQVTWRGQYFHLQVGVIAFHWNVGEFLTDYATSHTRIHYFSQILSYV
jgi:hypothetical protein